MEGDCSEKIAGQEIWRWVAVMVVVVWVGMAWWASLQSAAVQMAVVDWLRMPAFDWFFRAVSVVGSGWGVVAFCVLLFLLGRTRSAVAVAVGGIILGLVVQLMKSYFNVPRPAVVVGVPEWFDYTPALARSFPSGHAASAFYMAGVASRWGWRWLVVFLMLGVLVGISRVYLYEHFWQDVLMGSLLGLGMGVIVAWTSKRVWGDEQACSGTVE